MTTFTTVENLKIHDLFYRDDILYFEYTSSDGNIMLAQMHPDKPNDFFPITESGDIKTLPDSINTEENISRNI